MMYRLFKLLRIMRNKAKRDVEKILPIILYTGKSLMVERDAGTDPRWMGGQPREEQTKKGAGGTKR